MVASLFETLMASLRADQEALCVLQAMNNEGHVLISWEAEAEQVCLSRAWDITGCWWSNRTKKLVKQTCDKICDGILKGESREETKMCDVVEELLRWRACQEAKQIIDTYLSKKGVIDEQIALILIHGIKKYAMHELGRYLYPTYAKQNLHVQDAMERKLLPILLSEDYYIAGDEAARNLLKDIAQINPLALLPHIHVLLKLMQSGKPQLSQFALFILSNIKNDQVTKQLQEGILHSQKKEPLSPMPVHVRSRDSGSDYSSDRASYDSLEPKSPKNIKLKATFGDETHIIVLTPEMTYSSLKRKIKSLSHEIRNFHIEYQDDEGDTITINSEHDFEEFVEYARANMKNSLKCKVRVSTSVQNNTGASSNSPQSATTISTTDDSSFLCESCSDGGSIQWRKGGLIGSGGSGKVFLGLDLNTGAMIAVKKIRLPDITNAHVEKEVKQIENEVRLMKTMKHENIVNYLGYCREGNKLFIFLEYMSGGSLSSIVNKFGGALPEVVIQKYLSQILSGLYYLHCNGVIHRDIKGANLLIDHGDVKLSDFGLSKMITRDMNNSFSTKGTPAWMSPEIITKQQYSFASDIWALGCTILEMITGRPPWDELGISDPIQLMIRIASTNSPPMIPRGRMSDNLYDLVMKCFAIKPQDRATAEELLHHPFLTEVTPMSTDKNINMQDLATTTIVSPESFSEYEGSWLSHGSVDSSSNEDF